MKIVKKSCPECGLEAAVARKICTGCNKPFIKKNTLFKIEKSVTTSSTENEAATCDRSTRKWPERIMRGKPHFYDAADFLMIRKKKKKRGRKKKKPVSMSSDSSSSSSSSAVSTSTSSSGVLSPSTYWGLSIWKHPKPSLTAEIRKKCYAKMDKKMDVKHCDKMFDDPFDYEQDSSLKPEQMSLILQELNYKLRLTTWRA